MKNCENNLYINAGIQKKLFKPLCGQDGLDKRIKQAKKGQMPLGSTLDKLHTTIYSKNFEEILGDFASKVLIVTHPESYVTLIPEQITVAGGWCALRTADVENMDKNGILMNPETGNIEKIISVNQVCEWIQKSISFDQIIECVGGVNASQIMAISERKLWSERVSIKLEKIFNRSLSSQEKDRIQNTIEVSEYKRYRMTERYLQYILGNNTISLTRVVDEDIWEDLGQARDELLREAQVTIGMLSSSFSEPYSLTQSRSLVYAMYAEPYFKKLKKGGIINTEKFYVVEPVIHTYGTSQSDNYIVQNIYQEKGVYFDSNGINANTGYIAFVECLTSHGKSVRKMLNINAVPNISNWETLFLDAMNIKSSFNNYMIGCLKSENNKVINPSENNLFIWGLNFLPFGDVQNALLGLISIAEQFKQEKAHMQSQYSFSVQKNDLNHIKDIQTIVQDVKKRYLKEIDKFNCIIEIKLKEFFSFINA